MCYTQWATGQTFTTNLDIIDTYIAIFTNFVELQQLFNAALQCFYI